MKEVLRFSVDGKECNRVQTIHPGVILDHRLTFVEHLSYLGEKERKVKRSENDYPPNPRIKRSMKCN